MADERCGGCLSLAVSWRPVALSFAVEVAPCCGVEVWCAPIGCRDYTSSRPAAYLKLKLEVAVAGCVF